MAYKIVKLVQFLISKQLYLHLKIFVGTFVKRNKFAINGIDTHLDEFLNYSDGIYVELGANDGVTQSNTLRLEKKRRWRGLLIEPYPENYMYCQFFRGKNNDVVCTACVDAEFTDKFVELQYSNLTTAMKESSQLGNDDNKLTYLKDYEKPTTFGALASTLSSLLTKLDYPGIIDFLSVDVEGAEISVLNGINFSIHNFKYILIETSNFQEVNLLMFQNNYKLVKKISHHDYLFSYNQA